MIEYLTDCSGIECNRMYHLCNTDNNAATDTGIYSQNGTLIESTTPEITLPTSKPNGNEEKTKTKSLEDPHTSMRSEVECSDMVSIQAMGAMIGILVVLLVAMTSGYIYICWNNMKKRGGLRIISKQMAR